MVLGTKISATRPRGRYRIQQKFVTGDAGKFKHILCARAGIYLKGVQKHHPPSRSLCLYFFITQTIILYLCAITIYLFSYLDSLHFKP